jgi:hypothetical protein
LYGWDSRSQTWHGPNELGSAVSTAHRLFEQLLGAPGRSWYGPVNCSLTGEAPGRFFAVVHGLRDCAVAMVYWDESKAGPAEIVAVVPASARGRLRQDFAFELVAFANFLCSLGEGAEMAVHDGIAAALAETSPNESLVFSISTDLGRSDADHVLSLCVEKVARSMLRWLEEDSPRNRNGR